MLEQIAFSQAEPTTVTPNSSAQVSVISWTEIQNKIVYLAQLDRVRENLSRLFGVQLTSISPAFLNGTSRKGDEAIAAGITSLLRERCVVNCLELGAGSTYTTHNEHYGAPWFARALTTASKTTMTIIASDLRGNPGPQRSNAHFQFFYVSPQGDLHTQSCVLQRRHKDEPLLEDIAIYSALTSSGIVCPVETTPFLEKDDRFSKAVRKFWGDINAVAPARVLKDGLFFIRPCVDPEVEAILYGLYMKQSTDCHKIGKSFHDQKFDIIYMRHLDPVLHYSLDLIRASCNNHLTEGGLLIGIDR